MRRALTSARTLGLVLAVALVSPCGAMAQDTDSFVADLDACRELVRKRSWKRGRAAYEKLLVAYESDPRAVAAAAGIERDVQLCLFNVGRRVPTGEELFGPHVVKFSAGSRQLDMVFPKGLDDAPWEKFGETMKTLPMRFADSLVVTVPAAGSKTKFEKERSSFSKKQQVRVRVLFALNMERSGGYLAVPPYTYDFSDSDYTREDDPTYPLADHFRLFDLAETPARLIKKEYWWGKRASAEKGRCRWVRVTHKGGLIKLEADGCRQMGARDKAHDGGYLAISAYWVTRDASRPPISIRLQGQLDRTYLTKLIAQHEDAAFQTWKEKDYRREDVLPRWLFEVGATAAVRVVALPEDLPEEHREQVAAFLAWMLSSETTTKMDLPDPDGLPPASAALVAGALALMRGELLAADEHFTALLAADPSFPAALLWRARARYFRRDTAAADKDLAAAAEHLRDDPAFHELIATVHLSQGDIAAARAGLDAARAVGAWSPRLEELATGVHAADRGPHWARTFRKKTRHFEILTDHSQDMCQQVGNVLADAVRRFARSFRTIPEKRHPARVYVFSSRDAYDDFAKEVGSSLTHSAGAYLPRLHILVIWMPKDRRDFEATVRHEGFHQYAHHFLDDLPIWFNEGYAEYFGNVPHERAALGHATDKEDLGGRVKRYRDEFVSLPELIRMPRKDFMSKATPRYTQAWAAVTFLADSDDERVRGRLDRYFEALVGGQSAEQAYATVFADVEQPLSDLFEEFLDRLARR